MSNVFRKRGFTAHKKEETRKKVEKENRTSKLWRFFLADGEEDIPLRFLTEEPILFYEHSIQMPGNKWDNETCSGDDCEHCAAGAKPTYKGAWLVADGREREVDEYKDNVKTGKKRVIKDQIKLYVRGSVDIAKLDRLSRKFGLVSRPWFATKTGSSTTTSYELDRGEKSKLTKKEIQNLLAKAPEQYREIYTGDEEELYNMVEFNIFDDIEIGEENDTGRDDSDDDEDEDEDEDLDEGVESMDEDEDEDEDEEPVRKKPTKKPIKKNNEGKTGGSRLKKKPVKKSVFKR